MPVTITKGSAVEVTIDEPGFNGAWYTATFVDDVEASPTRKGGRCSNKKTRKGKKIGYLVKYNTLLNDDDLFEPLTEVVDPSFVRPSPPSNIYPVGGDFDFEVGDVVDAFHRDGWWLGVVKSVIIEGQIRNFIVSFQNPHEEFEFDRSKMRFHVDWIDSRWRFPPNKTAEQDAGARITDRGKRFRSSAGGKGNAKVTVCDDVHQEVNSPPVEHETVITQTGEKRKRETTPKSVVNKQSALQEGSSISSPPDHHNNSQSQTSAGTTTDYQQDWPFSKRSPLWAAMESCELYLTPPQKPHFSPLKEMKEDYREGLAIAHMVTFGNLVQSISNLQPNDSVYKINTSLETLSDLETHGFDVGAVRDRLNELLTLKFKTCQHEDTRKEVEKELEKCDNEKGVVEKEMDELRVKMEVLEAKLVRIANKRKVKEEELVRLQLAIKQIGACF